MELEVQTPVEIEVGVDGLIRLMKKKKPQALEKVMDLYLGSVYGVARSILYKTASEADIEECVQDVFVDAWNNIEKYNSERGSLKTWLLILCKYKALTLRKLLMNVGKVINIENVQLPVIENLEDNYIAKENNEEIITVINSFGDTDKEVLNLPNQKRENGLHTFGIYYVPAVEPKYLTQLPKSNIYFN